ncbi:MAG: hypothetical protein KBC84_09785, partial [Proteobacteria bacterium]|nr:hypothetical protein [Pseudomonadota bacterium]
TEKSQALSVALVTIRIDELKIRIKEGLLPVEILQLKERTGESIDLEKIDWYRVITNLNSEESKLRAVLGKGDRLFFTESHLMFLVYKRLASSNSVTHLVNDGATAHNIIQFFRAAKNPLRAWAELQKYVDRLSKKCKLTPYTARRLVINCKANALEQLAEKVSQTQSLLKTVFNFKKSEIIFILLRFGYEYQDAIDSIKAKAERIAEEKHLTTSLALKIALFEHFMLNSVATKFDVRDYMNRLPQFVQRPQNEIRELPVPSHHKNFSELQFITYYLILFPNLSITHILKARVTNIISNKKIIKPEPASSEQREVELFYARVAFRRAHESSIRELTNRLSSEQFNLHNLDPLYQHARDFLISLMEEIHQLTINAAADAGHVPSAFKTEIILCCQQFINATFAKHAERIAALKAKYQLK